VASLTDAGEVAIFFAMNTLSIPGQETAEAMVYPESDGAPMGDNDTQREIIVLLIENLKRLLAGEKAYVTGDLFWYPVKGRPEIVQAPDAMVVFGREMVRRRTYKQWEEEDVVPQVVFEVRSHSNTDGEMKKKREFYETHGVEEYFMIDPERETVEGWIRKGQRLAEISPVEGVIRSPRLKIAMGFRDGEPHITGPDGRVFTMPERWWKQAEHEAERAELETQRAGEALSEVERLKALLRDKGIGF